MGKNPKTPYIKSFLGVNIDFMPIDDLFEPLKLLRPFKMAKLHYLGHIWARQRTQKWLKTLKPPMPYVFWGLLLFLYPYMTFFSLSELFNPVTKPDPHFFPTVQWDNIEH